MKKFISFLLAIILCTVFTATAFAEQQRAFNSAPSLSFSGTTANCKVTITDAGQEIKATMTLWDGSKCIGTWSNSGKSMVSVTGSCTVESGRSYTLKVSGTSGGTAFSLPSTSKTCG